MGLEKNVIFPPTQNVYIVDDIQMKTRKPLSKEGKKKKKNRNPYGMQLSELLDKKKDKKDVDKISAALGSLMDRKMGVSIQNKALLNVERNWR